MQQWLTTTLMFGALTLPHTPLCSGFLPENDLQIPVSVMQTGGITQAEFNEALDKVEAFYAPIVRARGATLEINREWDNGTVNASADQYGRTWFVNMYGGLARHPVMTKDGFTLVACHELGHHIGGAPKYQTWFGSDWATNEGGADYFATFKCLTNIFTSEDNAEFVRTQPQDPALVASCVAQFSRVDEQNFCIRAGAAGLVGASLFKVIRKIDAELRFETPDATQVSKTFDGHPMPQCRLDTYFNGALCDMDRQGELSDRDPNQGVCAESRGQQRGTRPRCWFAP